MWKKRGILAPTFTRDASDPRLDDKQYNARAIVALSMGARAVLVASRDDELDRRIPSS
jgi:hypothetical protein